MVEKLWSQVLYHFRCREKGLLLEVKVSGRKWLNTSFEAGLRIRPCHVERLNDVGGGLGRRAAIAYEQQHELKEPTPAGLCTPPWATFSVQ